MIDQIYTYFTIEIVFLWLNLGVLPFWLILVFFPQSQICRVFITSIFRKIDVIKTLHICDCGKKTNISQKGNTPRFNQRKTISIVKYV